MADWPDIEELKQVLNITSEDWDGDAGAATLLEGVLQSAIEKVKNDVGEWDDAVDVPDASLATAALRMAELMALRPESAAQFAAQVGMGDTAYQSHMTGHRRRFGIS